MHPDSLITLRSWPPWGPGCDERQRLLSAKLTHYHAAKLVKPDLIGSQSLGASIHLSIGPKSTIMMIVMMTTMMTTTTTMVMVVLIMMIMMMMMITSTILIMMMITM